MEVRKLGIVVPVFNRPDYIKQCLDSLKASRIPEATAIVFVDDGSTDKDGKVVLGIKDFKTSQVFGIYNAKNEGVCYCIKTGIEKLIAEGCNLFMNLDSDAIVRADWIEKILSLKEKFPDKIVTGFNCLTRNANGSERHPIIETGEGYNIKSSVGGLNMCFNREQYETWILPALEKGMKRLVNWDAEACKNSGGAVCVVPSVVQHIGIISSMGHSSGKELPDVAEDFVVEEWWLDGNTISAEKWIGTVEPPEIPKDTRLHLPNVTLVTVNCDNIAGGIKAIEESEKGIKFGAVKFLTSKDIDEYLFIKIPHIPTVERYSNFIARELYKYIDTDYMLIVQSDGYVKNPAAWTDEFLKYDYIGATWWYNDKNIVGNGGFSLRSKKLMTAVANDRSIVKVHPEDHHICRTYRLHLERKHGIKFAPAELARKFSIEGYRQKNKTWSGEFGFHGGEVKFPEDTKIPKYQNNNVGIVGSKKPDIILFNQPFGLGDFLFCVPLARDYIKEGFKVVWPVVPQYDNINKHFPEITFINKEMLKVDYERKDEYELNGMRVIPLRWSYEILKVPFRDCMKSKYLMFKKDWHRWRECTWVRDTAKEDELFYKVLGLHDGAEYNLTNTMFRSDGSGKALFNVSNGYKNIPLQNIEGFTLLDWGKVLENAMTIHTVSTSINYLLELMTLKAKEIHLYCRKPDERNFNNIDYLFTKKYKLHY